MCLSVFLFESQLSDLDTGVLLRRNLLGLSLFRREGGDDFLEARIAAEGVPEGQ
jgi:hypothetical protein